jgi:CheY-like chemotaxis protein
MDDRPALTTQRIALSAFAPELSELLESVLAAEGYAPQPLDLGPLGTDTPAGLPPDLVVLAVGDPASLGLLDRLRTSPATTAVPVIVLGTLPPVQEQAQASGNVYAVLSMPFHLDELLEAVEGALAQRPFEARIQDQPSEPDPTVLQSAEVLLRSQRELMLDWVQRIRAVEPFVTRNDIDIRGFLNSLPRIVNALVLVLRQQAPPEVLTRDLEMQGRIREHAHTRQRQGVAAEAVVREYQVLRETISRRLRR